MEGKGSAVGKTILITASAAKQGDELESSTAEAIDPVLSTKYRQSGKSQHIQLLSEVSNFANRSMQPGGQLLPVLPRASRINQRTGSLPLRHSTLPLKSLQGHIFSNLEHVTPSQLIKPLGHGPFPPLGARPGSLGPLSNLVPSAIGPFENRSIPPTKRPANEVLPSGKRNAAIKKRRLEKQAAATAQLLDQRGPSYPFHHTFRPMPGENLPSSHSTYPSLASLDPLFASSVILLPQQQQDTEHLSEEAHTRGKGNLRAHPVITTGAGQTSQPRRKGSKKKDVVQTDQTSPLTTAVDTGSGKKGTARGLQMGAQADAQHGEADVGTEKGATRAQDDGNDPGSNRDAGAAESGRLGEAQGSALVDSSAAFEREKGLDGADPKSIQPPEKAGTGADGGTVAAEPEAMGGGGIGVEDAQAGPSVDGLKHRGASDTDQVDEGENTQPGELPISGSEARPPCLVAPALETAGSSEGAAVPASTQNQASTNPADESTSEAALNALPFTGKKRDGPVLRPPGAPAVAMKKQRIEPSGPEGGSSEVRWKPCNSCRKARKGGCGTEDAPARCELINGSAGAAVSVLEGIKPVRAEVRPWASHLPAELRAQIIAGSGELSIPGAAMVGVVPTARIPYLYFGTCPSDSTTPRPEAGGALKRGSTTSIQSNSQSYPSRLSQPPPVPFVPNQILVPQRRAYDFPTPSKILSARGPLSQQVKQIFNPSHPPPPAPGLAPRAPGLALLPQVAQMFEGRPLPSYLESFNARLGQPPLKPARAPPLNPNLVTGTLSANLAPPFPAPAQLSIPHLPAFRNPPTSSVGAQILAPRPSSSNLALLGPFLRAHDFARGSLPQGQASTDVIRIRGGGPRGRKRKQRGAGGSETEPKRTRKEAGTDGGEEVSGGTGVRQDGNGANEKGEGAGGGTEVFEEPGGLGNTEGDRNVDSGATSSVGRYELRRSARVKKAETPQAAGQGEGTQAGASGATVSRRTARTAKKGSAREIGSSRQGGTSDGVDGTGERPNRSQKRAAEGGSATVAEGLASKSEAAGNRKPKGGDSASKRRKKGDREQTGKEDTEGVLEGDVDGPSESQRKGRRARQKKGKQERTGSSTKAAAVPAGRKGGRGKGQKVSGKAPLIVFAHGAGAGASSPFMQRWKELLRTALDAADVVTFDYPYLAGGKKGAPPKAEKLIDFHTETIRQAQAKHPGCPLVLAGKSMGSRVSCMIGGQDDAGLDIAAVVCLGYPLKGMGKGPLREQTLLDLKCPVLFVQGSRDSMCPLDLLADVQARMSASNDIHVVEGGDHGLSVGSRALKAQEISQEDVESAVLEAITSFLGPLL